MAVVADGDTGEGDIAGMIKHLFLLACLYRPDSDGAVETAGDEVLDATGEEHSEYIGLMANEDALVL